MKDLHEGDNFADLDNMLEGYWSIQIENFDTKKLENKIQELQLECILEVYEFIKFKIRVKLIKTKCPS